MTEEKRRIIIPTPMSNATRPADGVNHGLILEPDMDRQDLNLTQPMPPINPDKQPPQKPDKLPH